MNVAVCQGHIYECGDLVDNDADGLIDAEDPDCLGPCDNSENSYYSSNPDALWGCTVDCYFDQDGGSGNDECHWDFRCDPLEVPPDYHPESQLGSKCAYNPGAAIPGTTLSCVDLSQAQSQTCHSFCGPLTPNGCDCFGCCELPAGSGKFVYLASEYANSNGSCTRADVADPTKCQPCTPVPGCLNPCDPCELCIGRPAPDPTCGGGAQCAAGLQPCGLPGQSPCLPGFYCVSGCCQPNPQ
jgi:hypothetical protein